MTTTKRLKFPIYVIEQDNGVGRIVKKYSFVRQEGTLRIHAEGHPNLVSSDIMDGGLAGWITSPVGYTLVETDTGETVIVSPENDFFSAGEAVSLGAGPNEFRFGWIKANPLS